MLNKISDKKIIFFTPETIPSNSGAGINCFRFARFLKPEAKQVSICALNYNRLCNSSERVDNVLITRLNYFNSNLLSKIYSLPGLLYHYTRLVFKNDIIFIYSGFLVGYEWIILMALLFRRKIIFRPSVLDGDDIRNLIKRYGIFSRCIKFMFQRLSLYFSINPEFSSRYNLTLPKNNNLFESFQGIDSIKFHPVPEEMKKELRQKLKLPDIPLILSVGYVIKRKGYADIIKQLSKIKVDFQYLIIGDYKPTDSHKVPDNEFHEMNEIVGLGNNLLQRKIRFLGPKRNVEEYLQACDIFLHGSIQEGTPNAVLEAMASGIVTITKKIKGVSGFLLKDKINTLEFNKFEELPDIINQCLHDKAGNIIIAKNASDLILNKYTFDKVANKLFSQLFTS